MSIENVFTPRVAARPTTTARDTRADMRPDPRADNRADVRGKPRTETTRGSERASDRTGDERVERESRTPTRAEFSALLALIAGAGSKVREDLMRQAPADGVSLLDKLLQANMEGGEGGALDQPVGESPSDALRYGILKESTAGLTAQLSVRQTAMQVLGGAADNPPSSAPIHPNTEHARLNEVIGRIVATRGSSVDQLKARGDDQAADLRAALDALLSQAGTPVGLELAGNASVSSEQAALAAAATALVNAASASAADVTVPVRTTDALAPTLREKLDRVVDRMKREYGHDVTVVETARSQERQDHLYEQGRTRAGSVVTWTRDSAHTHGDAVDVIVDGSWNNAEGFGRLQRIAKEEGLRTLGVRDPGHLELPLEQQRTMSTAAVAAASRAAASRSAVTATPLITNAGAQGGMARVAGVASAASVAGVARVGDPGSARQFDRAYSPTSSSGMSPTALPIAGSSRLANNSQQNTNTDGESQTARRSSSSGLNGGAEKAPAEYLAAPDSSAFSSLNAGALRTATTDGASATAAAAPAAADSASRVADLQQMRDNAPAGAVSRVTLSVDAPDGSQDRITVDLRGSQVGTHINTDAANADRLRMRTAELQDALGRHGLESDQVQISSGARSESGDAARALTDRDGVRLPSAQASTAGDGATNQGQRDRSANAREWDRPDQSRQSRDEERQEGRQGAGQRGQRGTYNGSAS